MRNDRKMNFADMIFLNGKITPSINPELTDSEMNHIYSEFNFTHLRVTGKTADRRLKFALGRQHRNKILLLQA
jgi:hypothetical protein